MIQIKFSPKSDDVKTKTSNDDAYLVWLFLREVCYLSKDVEWAIEELKKPDGEPSLNDCWAVRDGNQVKIFHTVLECIPDALVPHDKFVDLLEQWKLILVRQGDKSIYDHDYNEMTIFADDDYNFTVMVDGKMVEN